MLAVWWGRTYLCEPIKRLLGQLVLFAMVLEVRDNAWPYALELGYCGWHFDG